MFFSRRSRQTLTWLLVFLGNPGDRFDNTRHNIGYYTCDVLADRVKKRVQRVKFKSWVADFDYGGVRVLAMKPTTYMNLSGEAVREAAAFYKIPPERILVVCDDISLPTGKLRLRRSGSAGGHNGLKSIIAQLHSDQFPRLKMGVGQKPHPDYDLADWVLGKFSPADAKIMNEAAERACDAIECLLSQGMDKAMSKFN